MHIGLPGKCSRRRTESACSGCVVLFVRSLSLEGQLHPCVAVGSPLPAFTITAAALYCLCGSVVICGLVVCFMSGIACFKGRKQQNQAQFYSPSMASPPLPPGHQPPLDAGAQDQSAIQPYLAQPYPAEGPAVNPMDGMVSQTVYPPVSQQYQASQAAYPPAPGPPLVHPDLKH